MPQVILVQNTDSDFISYNSIHEVNHHVNAKSYEVWILAVYYNMFPYIKMALLVFSEHFLYLSPPISL